MNGQEIILALILIMCLAWSFRRIVLCYKRIKRGGNPCESCGGGCRCPRNRLPEDCAEKKKTKS